MASLTQDGRLLRIRTALGEGVFLLRRLVVSEALEQPFSVQGELVSTQVDITPDQLIATAVTCWIDTGGAAPRQFHGIVSSFGRIGTSMRDLHGYRFEAVPTFWFLTRSMDCRIFQDESVETIVRKVVEGRRAGPVAFRHMPAGNRAYCVQFNETDFDFVHRLLDESGCCYFFEQSKGSHGFTVVGDAAGFPQRPRADARRARRAGPAGRGHRLEFTDRRAAGQAHQLGSRQPDALGAAPGLGAHHAGAAPGPEGQP